MLEFLDCIVDFVFSKMTVAVGIALVALYFWEVVPYIGWLLAILAVFVLVWAVAGE